MNETALKQVHLDLGARMVPFGGWEMPVQYRPILDEARTVRTRAGIFDLGHMGRVRIGGRDATAFLQRLQTNDVTQIQPGRIRYAMILNEQGLTQDDILVYRNPGDDGFFLVLNAGNTARDLEIMRRLATGFGDLLVDDCTHRLGMIAIQGPLSAAITQRFCDGELESLKYYGWNMAKVCSVPMLLSRTGYTGEDGFEIYVPEGHELTVWNAFLAAGKPDGLTPIGLGARDTLRHEAGMPLYGHEIDETTNPLEAGLDWAVKWNHDFVGRAALERVQQAGGTGRTLVGLTSASKRCPRQGYKLVAGGQEIGQICSGNISPTLDTNIATAYVRSAFGAPGTQLEFLIKDKAEPCKVVPLPFYKRPR
ncbi:MAG TPA: glycine cleavage system aminomethyltransferase GcvT [Planctomycetota bacterium]|nr:glycine cleavage system aminomethyltransferase GcvT [Planctomycetota bacterium]